MAANRGQAPAQSATMIQPGAHGSVVPRHIQGWNDLHGFEQPLADDIISHLARANCFPLAVISNQMRHQVFDVVFDLWSSTEDAGVPPVFRDAHGNTLRNASYRCGVFNANADVNKEHRQAGAPVFCRAQPGNIMPTWRFVDARGSLVAQRYVQLAAPPMNVLASACLMRDAAEYRRVCSYNRALAVFWIRERVAHIARGYIGPVTLQQCNYAELIQYKSLFDDMAAFQAAITNAQQQQTPNYQLI